MIGNHGCNAVQFFHSGFDIVHISGGNIIPHDDEMGRCHIKIIFELVIAHDRRRILRQGFIQFVKIARVSGRVKRGYNRKRQNHKHYHSVTDHKIIGTVKTRNQDFMAVFFNAFVKQQKHGRQNQYDSRHAQYHAFCHDKSHIPAQAIKCFSQFSKRN